MSISQISSHRSYSRPHALDEVSPSLATQAESDAQSRIQTAQQEVQNAELDASESIDHIRDVFSKQYENINSKQEAELENEKSKGYERIRDLQRAQQSELRKTREKGEEESQALQNYYRNSIYNTENEGDKKLRDLYTQQHQQLEYEKEMADQSVADIHADHTQRMEQLKESHDDQIERIRDGNEKDIEKMKSSVEQAKEEAQTHYQDKFQKLITQQRQSIGKLNDRAGRMLKEIREDTSEKLAAYGSRQSDPFYKLLNVNAHFHDMGDSYVVTARIPEYEQGHISAVIRGNSLVISGSRKNQENLDLGRGHVEGSSSFQSFHEDFPLPWPVDGKLLTKEFQGDQVIIRVPKKGQFAYRQPQHIKPDIARAEPPHFPDNINHVLHHDKSVNGGDASDKNEAKEAENKVD